jgi:hypothetical protein
MVAVKLFWLYSQKLFNKMMVNSLFIDNAVNEAQLTAIANITSEQGKVC